MVLSQFPARFGKYILLDRLAAGGMAEVFRAKITGAEDFERLVAIKCMLPQLLEDEQFTSMFIDEAKLAAQLAHANIVQIYELGREGERLFIAMELVHGRDLRHILRSQTALGYALDPKFAAYVISRAALGLDFAHRRLSVNGNPLNLVHRDVSPQNILVSYDGEVKVVDFGIAKAEIRRTETQTGTLKGKFAYMSPEQVQGLPFDHRADIFALGSVLYEALTGERLFAGENELTVLERVREAALPDLKSALAPTCHALRHILLRALAREPEERYAFASEMSDDLDAFLIEDRSIFAAKGAARVMADLYGEEIRQNADRLRTYASLTPEDVADHTPPGGETPVQAIFHGGMAARPVLAHTDTAVRVEKSASKQQVVAPPPTSGEPAAAMARAPEPPSAPPATARAPAAPAPRPSRKPEAAAPAEVPDDGPRDGDGPRDWRSLVEATDRVTLRPSGAGRPAARPPPRAEEATAKATSAAPPAPLLPPPGRFRLRLRRRSTRRRRATSWAIWRMRLALLGSLAVTLGLVIVAGMRLEKEGRMRALAHRLGVPEVLSHAVAPLEAPAKADDEGGEEGQEALSGYLFIRSATGDQPMVRIDGKEVGSLPLPPLALPVGVHEVELAGEEGSPRRVRRAPVTITPNHTQRAPRHLAF